MIRPEVLLFTNEMERVLKNNDHKTGWSEMTPNEIISRIVQEVRELSDLIYLSDLIHHEIYQDEPSLISKYRVIDEAVDIANFCMFLVTNLNNQKEPFL